MLAPGPGLLLHLGWGGVRAGAEPGGSWDPPSAPPNLCRWPELSENEDIPEAPGARHTDTGKQVPSLCLTPPPPRLHDSVSVRQPRHPHSLDPLCRAGTQ